MAVLDMTYEVYHLPQVKIFPLHSMHTQLATIIFDNVTSSSIDYSKTVKKLVVTDILKRSILLCTMLAVFICKNSELFVVAKCEVC